MSLAFLLSSCHKHFSQTNYSSPNVPCCFTDLQYCLLFLLYEPPYSQSLLLNSFIFLRPTQVCILSEVFLPLSPVPVWRPLGCHSTLLGLSLQVCFSQKTINVVKASSLLIMHGRTQSECVCQSFKWGLNNTAERQDMNSNHLYSSYHLQYSLYCFFCICLNFHTFRFKRILSSKYLQTIS